MEMAAEIREKLAGDWLPRIYEEKVRVQRTRAHHLDVPKRENRATVLHTLLGIELKIGNKRFSCPDLSTARYLQVFARIGCQEIAIPYDITKISTIADDLESSRQKILLLFEDATHDKIPSAKGRMRSTLIRQIREEIEEIGAGELMPEFRQTTKQRNS